MHLKSAEAVAGEVCERLEPCLFNRLLYRLAYLADLCSWPHELECRVKRAPCRFCKSRLFRMGRLPSYYYSDCTIRYESVDCDTKIKLCDIPILECGGVARPRTEVGGNLIERALRRECRHPPICGDEPFDIVKHFIQDCAFLDQFFSVLQRLCSYPACLLVCRL